MMHVQAPKIEAKHFWRARKLAGSCHSQLSQLGSRAANQIQGADMSFIKGYNLRCLPGHYPLPP